MRDKVDKDSNWFRGQVKRQSQKLKKKKVFLVYNKTVRIQKNAELKKTLHLLLFYFAVYFC